MKSQITAKRYVERFQFDEEYVRLLTEGDEAVENHFNNYFRELLTCKIRARLRRSDLVDDVVQDTLSRVLNTLRNKGGITTPQALGAYVNSVCNNVLHEYYRQERKSPAVFDEMPEVPSREPSAETRMAEAQQQAQVRRVLAELPEKDRAILYQLYYEERDKDEICRQLRVDREYLRVLVHRAIGRLRTALAKTQAAKA